MTGKELKTKTESIQIELSEEKALREKTDGDIFKKFDKIDSKLTWGIGLLLAGIVISAVIDKMI